MRRVTPVRFFWGVFALVLVLLVVKVFVADVYKIDSGSMRPTLFGGADRPGGEVYDEWVLVCYGARAP
jgi:signal peptidase I